MKIYKKFEMILIIILIVAAAMSNSVLALTKTSIQVIQKNSETKYLEKNQGSILSQIVNTNSETEEINVKLAINNMAQNEAQTQKYENTEVLIIVSEDINNNIEEFNKYVSYIETLSKKILAQNANTKIGIIGMKGTISDRETIEGKVTFGPNDEGDKLGSEKDAEILINVGNDVEAIKNALKEMNNEKNKYYQNLQAAIKLAKNSYSQNVNKILISLYDNVPQISIGTARSITTTIEDLEKSVKKKYQNIVNETKSEILGLKNNNIDFILLRPENNSFDEKWHNITTGELTYEFDGSEYVKSLYGTIENPSYGKMYELNEANFEKVVTENIYNDVIEKTGSNMKNVQVKKYFPKEVLNNFNILITSNNKNDVNVEKLQTDGYIIWNIGDLKSSTKVELNYTMKLKNTFDVSVLNKNIMIAEKIQCTYVDYNNNSKEANVTNNPKIKIVKTEENNKGDNNLMQNKDTTTATGKIPQTGIYYSFALIIAIMFVFVVSYKKYNSTYKDIK